jgi:hypothetical protein
MTSIPDKLQPAGVKKTAAGPGKKPAPKPKKLKDPASVTITCPAGTYAQAVVETKRRISLLALGIQEFRAKRAITGTLVYEIPGPEGKEKAALLHSKLAKVFAGSEGVKVARPYKKAELRLKDLDDATTTTKVVAAVASSGGCDHC